MGIPQADVHPGESPPSPAGWGSRAAWLGVVLLCLLHTLAVWVGMGGQKGVFYDWPILANDHGIHFQHGLVARDMLRATGTSVGYDPSFMSGYPLSIVSDLSSTLSDLFIRFAGDRPTLGYKLYVLVCTASVVWLMALASIAWKTGPTATLITTLMMLIYFWTDFSYKYAWLGMIGFLVSVPLGLLAVAALSTYFDRGGFGRWLIALAMCSAVFLVHLTSPMVVAPAGLLAYGVAIWRSRREGRPFPISRHLGLWVMAPLILLANAFWLLPGILLASTKGASEFAFAHPESVIYRVFEIFWTEWPLQSLLLGLGVLGLAIIRRRQPVAMAGLAAFMALGFFWGYLGGLFRSLDSLQPGRQTYACYAAASIASGVALAEVLAKLRSGTGMRLDRWIVPILLLFGFRVYAPFIWETLKTSVAPVPPFLSGLPTDRTLWVVSMVKKHLKPGERLLFEESGLANIDVLDPYGNQHISPILPYLTGVQVLGGPYLHATVTANFTQFGENKLFGRKDWDRDFFMRYARLYRPSVICCWTPKAVKFCQANPALFHVLESDTKVVMARVIGFEGATIQGKADVTASPNRLVIRNAVADPGGDGKIILRYHWTPYLKADPPVPIEQVLLEDDPVPFIKISPTAGPVTIEMHLPFGAK